MTTEILSSLPRFNTLLVFIALMVKLVLPTLFTLYPFAENLVTEWTKLTVIAQPF